MGYPLNAYSQIGEYNEDVQAYTKNFEAQWQNPDNETLMGMGEGVYLVQCAPCHGITGDGINGYAQDFHARMSKEQVLNKINNGSKGLNYPMGEMPPGMASGKDAEEIAEWIAGGMKGEKPASFAACASCHGEDGKGLGGQSPNLTEYDQTLTNKVLKHGRVGVIGTMPSFDDGRLTDIQKKAVGMYINSLLND
jgi:cytochrome c oxidase cbb3-type subunit 3